ncbi:Homeodomain-like domain-containing protein [Marinobacter sp. DSM 26671]|jgi:transposase InsO family protein|uniref:Transposase n=2 Tax=Pseudomonadota TaxID=1224 RepID=A0A916QNQ1_9GAMM|nr:transposase [Spongiibacter sp. IMCC21906]SFF06334.1 Homeodomain-like domain-containing protein [Marinobacter sp. DSM 26671]GFZ82504.1 transposase [Pseudohongiella nitratireducens]AKH68812.1 transposase [Spongiibacter sp. IMCC21906]AKH69154.1 transposase [Spongiibacter sp. IMCC21906]
MISTPDRERAVRLIKETTDAGARTFRACAEMGIAMRTYQRWTREGDVKADGRPGATRPPPVHKLTQQEREAVLVAVNSPVHRSLPPSQIVPALADEGCFIASESTFYRVLREQSQQQHRGRSKAPTAKPLNTHCATGPNQVWCWDVTWLPGPAKGIFFYLYLILDLYSRKIVGWEIHEGESSELASELVTKAYLREGIAGVHLVLHSDNGSPMKGASLMETLYRLGIMSSYSRPRVSNDNAYAESIFRTCKYRPDYPYKGFATLGDARAWVLQFATWYNQEHKHSGLKFITPAQRHSGQTTEVIQQRKAVYEAAKAANPKRWSGRTRNWDLPEEVWLNPEKESRSLEAAA